MHTIHLKTTGQRLCKELRSYPLIDDPIKRRTSDVHRDLLPLVVGFAVVLLLSAAVIRSSEWERTTLHSGGQSRSGRFRQMYAPTLYPKMNVARITPSTTRTFAITIPVIGKCTRVEAAIVQKLPPEHRSVAAGLISRAGRWKKSATWSCPESLLRPPPLHKVP